jgi:acyl carrier protein
MPPDFDSVIAVVTRVGGIPEVGADQDIFEAGVSSVSALELLLELESEFGVSIPDDEFVSARTPRAIHDLVSRLARGVA